MLLQLFIVVSGALQVLDPQWFILRACPCPGACEDHVPNTPIALYSIPLMPTALEDLSKKDIMHTVLVQWHPFTYRAKGTNVSRKENFLHKNECMHKFRILGELSKLTSGTEMNRTGISLLLGALYLHISPLEDVILRIIHVLKLMLLIFKNSVLRCFPCEWRGFTMCFNCY